MDWKKIVATVAPGIATALGGPLAGVAVGVLGKALLGDEAAGEDAVADAVLQANPEALARVKAAEFEFRARMKELDIDLERIHGADRDSARAMATASSLKPQIILATIFIAGFVAVLWAVFSGAVALDDTSRQIATVMLGILAAGITQIMNFFFGSSSGSKEKTAILGRPGG